MAESEEEMHLSAKECQDRINQFVEITNTDEAEAQSVLQDNRWNVEAAVNAFLAASQPDPSMNVTTKPPSTLSMITWNIDGLEEKNLPRRTAFVINELKKIKPDIVFLQEATDMIVEQLERHLIDYHVIEQGGLAGGSAGYFTCVLMRRTTIYLDGAQVEPFENSVMGRGIQRVMAHVGKVKFCLMNVHLESTKDFSKQRTHQFQSCINEMKSIPSDTTVILAGDLNIRDSEVASINEGQGLPGNIEDVWETLGKRKEVQYTWDCLRNTNIQIPGRFKPRMRFDRVLVRKSQPIRATPKTFNLVGIEKVPGTQSFASDHWALLTTYDLVHE